MSKLIGYIRVSTDKQNLELQEDNLKVIGCYKLFCDIASGVKADRPELKEYLDYIREGGLDLRFGQRTELWTV